MGAIQKRTSIKGKLTYRAIIRRAGIKSLSKSFPKHALAKDWIDETEQSLKADTYREDEQLFGKLITRYIVEIGPIKPWGATKSRTLYYLREQLGHHALKDLTFTTLMAYAVMRRVTVDAATLLVEFSYISVVLTTAEDWWGAKPKLSEFKKCKSACKKLDVLGTSLHRDRRVTEDEVTRILNHHTGGQQPLADWVNFALCTAMRSCEIASLRWDDLSEDGKSITIRSRKHPKKKRDELVPLLPEARTIIARQVRSCKKPELIFPHRRQTISNCFREASIKAGVKYVRFHDLRHEAITRLFELGLDSMVVAVFSGHKDINTLKRYTHINANKVLDMLERKAKGAQ